MTTLSAPASIWGDFERIVWRQKYMVEPVKPVKDVCIDQEDNLSPQALIDLLLKAQSFKLVDCGIELQIYKTTEEIIKETQTRVEECEYGIMCDKNRLKKWGMISEEKADILKALCERFKLTLD